MTTSPPSTFLLHLNSPSRITYRCSTGSPSLPPTSPAGTNSSEPSSSTSPNCSSVNPLKRGTPRSSSSVVTMHSPRQVLPAGAPENGCRLAPRGRGCRRQAPLRRGSRYPDQDLCPCRRPL